MAGWNHRQFPCQKMKKVQNGKLFSIQQESNNKLSKSRDSKAQRTQKALVKAFNSNQKVHDISDRNDPTLQIDSQT